MQRITKRAAFKYFQAGKVISLCPCKMRPDGPFSSAYRCFPQEWMDHCENVGHFRPDSPLWKGDKQATAWEVMYNQWAFYNTSHETGYYAHYYLD